MEIVATRTHAPPFSYDSSRWGKSAICLLRLVLDEDGIFAQRLIVDWREEGARRRRRRRPMLTCRWVDEGETETIKKFAHMWKNFFLSSLSLSSIWRSEGGRKKERKKEIFFTIER